MTETTVENRLAIPAVHNNETVVCVTS